LFPNALSGGLSILPLAPLAAVEEKDLPAIIRTMEHRLRQETTTAEAGKLWTATDVLMGLRYPQALVAALLQGVHAMKESVTYQAIVEEKVVQARQEDLLQISSKRFGKPDESIARRVRGIVDPKALSKLVDRILDTATWDELLTLS
jgi:predicted transposase YdaD